MIWALVFTQFSLKIDGGVAYIIGQDDSAREAVPIYMLTCLRNNPINLLAEWQAAAAVHPQCDTRKSVRSLSLFSSKSVKIRTKRVHITLHTHMADRLSSDWLTAATQRGWYPARNVRCSISLSFAWGAAKWHLSSSFQEKSPGSSKLAVARQ